MALKTAATIAGIPTVRVAIMAILSDVESLELLLEGEGVGDNELDFEENELDAGCVCEVVGTLAIADTC